MIKKLKQNITIEKVKYTKEDKISLSKTFYKRFGDDILRKYYVKNYKKKDETGKRLAVIDVIGDAGVGNMQMFDVDYIVNLIDWNTEINESKQDIIIKKVVKEDYKGWKNYQTWNVNLWINNSKSIYNDRMSKYGTWNAKTVEYFVSEYFPRGTPDMSGLKDLNKVDWQGIADVWNTGINESKQDITIKKVVKENINNSLVKGVDEKILHSNKMIKFYTNNGDNSVVDLLGYWVSYNEYLLDFKKSGCDVSKVPSVARVSDNDGKKAAAKFIQTLFQIDSTGGDEYVTNVESKQIKEVSEVDRLWFKLPQVFKNWVKSKYSVAKLTFDDLVDIVDIHGHSFGYVETKQDITIEKVIKEKTEDDWLNWLNMASKSALSDVLTYYANKKRLWNKKIINLSAKDIKDLINFQKAINKNGIDEKEFNSYVTVESKQIKGNNTKLGVVDGLHIYDVYGNGKVFEFYDDDIYLNYSATLDSDNYLNFDKIINIPTLRRLIRFLNKKGYSINESKQIKEQTYYTMKKIKKILDRYNVDTLEDLYVNVPRDKLEVLNNFAIKTKYNQFQNISTINKEIEKSNYDFNTRTDCCIIDDNLKGGSIIFSNKIDTLCVMFYDYEEFPFEQYLHESKKNKQLKEELVDKTDRLYVGDMAKNENGDTCKIIAISQHYPDIKRYDTDYVGEDFWKMKGLRKELYYIAVRNLKNGDFFVYPTSKNSKILGI